MKKNSNKRRRIYPVIWSGIVVISLYLLVRFVTLSFSDNFGQADMSFIDTVFSGLCCKAMEEESSLVSYTADGNTRSIIPIPLVSNQMALAEYTDKNNVMTVQAQEYSSLVQKNSIKAEENTAVEAMDTSGVMNDFYKIPEKYLSKEYILTNGAIYNSDLAEDSKTDGVEDELLVGYEKAGVDLQEKEDPSTEDEDTVETASIDKAVSTEKAVNYTLNQLKDTNFLVRNFYIVDATTRITKKLFDGEKLLGINMKMKHDNNKPQILIYHTHSQEGYKDSKSRRVEDTVVGCGNVLTQILKDKYGYNVIHDTTTYDIVNGVENRNIAYTKAEDGITKILKDNPSIEVVIDLHRDSGKAQTVNINGKDSAKIMLFNGLSRSQNGPITYLNNPNLQNNLAFSLQLQLRSKQLYPGLFKRNYLKSYRYNLHVRPKSLLVELGTVSDTVQSAKNAMEPFAKVLDAVLQGD